MKGISVCLLVKGEINLKKKKCFPTLIKFSFREREFISVGIANPPYYQMSVIEGEFIRPDYQFININCQKYIYKGLSYQLIFLYSLVSSIVTTNIILLCFSIIEI